MARSIPGRTGQAPGNRVVRILIASGIAPPEIGGPATFISAVVPEFVSRGHDVRVVAFSDAGGPGVDVGAPVHRISAGTAVSRLAAYARTYRRLAASADLVLALGVLLPRVTPRGVPVVMKVPGDYAWERAIVKGWIGVDEPLDDFERRRHPWRVQWLKQWRRLEARRADRVVVPSRYLERLVTSWALTPGRVAVVPNAVAPPGDAARESPIGLRRSLGWSADERVLVVAGRLVPWKHVDLVIDAVADLPGVRLVVAGDGPERPRLVERARARAVRAEFVGPQPASATKALIRAADYLVLYSSYEGLSHTLIEALSLGTPVVASCRGGNPEVVQDEVNGLLVAHPDVGALNAALRGALSPARRATLAAGTQTGLARFDPTRVALALEEVFEAVVNRPTADGGASAR